MLTKGGMNANINNFFLVVDDFLNEETVEELYRSLIKEDFRAFFALKKDLNGGVKPPTQRGLINDVIHKTWMDKLSFLSGEVTGFEVWTNFMHGDNTLDLHIDCDEDHQSKTGLIRTPLYTSVLYLGPSSHLTGGELALGLQGHEEFEHLQDLERRCDPEYFQTEVIRKDDANWMKIPYKRNRLIVFDPSYPHQVLSIKKGTTEKSPRVGLTMAAWDREIKIMQGKEY